MLNYTFLDKEVDGKPDHIIIAIYTEHIDAYKSNPDFPEAYARLFHRRGKLYCKIEDYHSALNDLNIAVRHGKEDKFNLYGSRAVIHNHLKQYSSARNDYECAIEDVGKYITKGKRYVIIRSRLYYGMAQTQFNLKHYEEAIKYFEMVFLGEMPDSLPEGFVNYGRCYISLGNYEMADKVLKACEKGSPEDFYIKLNIAVNYIKWSENDPRKNKKLRLASKYLLEVENLNENLEITKALLKRCIE